MEKKRSWPIGTILLTTTAILALPVIILRYTDGLGAVSNLSDSRPWGLWISFDLYCGVALAAGGFTLAGAVYIFNLKKYYPVVRPAILTAFLGYTLVILALLIDLGQPWYIWHAIIYWNIHSPLFEVAICVMIYTGVLALEFSPAVFERLNWHVPLRIIRTIQIPLVIAGVTLSTLHQSSLGSMLLPMTGSLNALWYTPILPILFLISAVAVGPAMVIFESILSTKTLGHKLDLDVLRGLAKAIPYILGLYLLLKLLDLVVTGELMLVFSGPPQNILWWIEIIGGVVMPIILLSLPNVRQSKSKLFWCVSLVIGGLMLNRFNVTLLALNMGPSTTYFPHWMEFAISAGLIANALILFQLANRLLPIVHHEVTEEKEPKQVVLPVNPAYERG